jgi:hypothetical protein
MILREQAIAFLSSVEGGFINRPQEELLWQQWTECTVADSGLETGMQGPTCELVRCWVKAGTDLNGISPTLGRRLAFFNELICKKIS